jgi:hypothetical protein
VANRACRRALEGFVRGIGAHRQTEAVGRRGADQRRAAHQHGADGLGRLVEVVRRTVSKACGSRVWSMISTDQPSSWSQIVL